MASSSSSKVELQKFDGKGFELWKLKMEDHLVDRDLWGVIDDSLSDDEIVETVQVKEGETITKTSTKKKSNWDKIDRKARGAIRSGLTDSVLVNVTGEKTAKDLWNKLESMYQSKSLVNKLFLRKQLYKLRMEEGDSFTTHLNEFNTLMGQLQSIDCHIDDDDKAITLLCSLPDSWDNLIMSIGSDTNKLSFDNVVTTLLSENLRRQKMTGSSKEALTIRGRSRDRFDRKGGKRGNSRPRSKSKGKTERSCWKCGKTGHYKKDCKEKTDKKEGNEEAGDLYVAAAFSAQNDSDIWYVDTGASYHMTPHRDWFCEYAPYNGGNVHLGDDSTVKIVGRGKVKLKMHNGTIKTLPGVMHIPGLNRNLMSVGTMADSGVSFSCDSTSCKMTRGSLVLARGVRDGNLYKLQATVITDYGAGLIVDHEETPMLWHRRLGHIGESGMKTIADKKLLEGIPDGVHDFGFCEHCLHGKQNRVSFKTEGGKSDGILNLIHSDVFGPTPTPSLGNSRYYVSFVDDYSRYTWIYFMKSKSDVFSKFQEFKSLVENQFDRKIKVLRSDNGGEYCSEKFDKFCTTHGIARQKTTPYTPQQNGVAERLNRTLMERARSMLSGSDLGPEFWAEAVATACYLKNRTPTAALVDMTPYEALNGKKPNVSYIRVFGCDAYVHVPKEKRNKLDSKSVKCKFVGYKDGVKGYKLWNLDTGSIIYSRDVIFRETVTKEPETDSDIPKPVEVAEIEIEEKTDDTDTDTSEDDTSDNEDSVENNDDESEEEVEDSNNATEDAPDDECESESEIEPVTLRRSTRDKRPPDYYKPGAYAAFHASLICDTEPRTYEEARRSEESKLWETAMKEEMDSLYKNETWDLVKPPKDRKAIGCKWVFKRKVNSEGKIEKYKARLVAKGYFQIEGIDYGEVFSPVAKLTSIRTVLSMAATYDLEIEQLDVKTAFLHGDLKEEIYMKQPEGYFVKGKEDYVCKLKKSLYGLKQSPRMWYQKFDTRVLQFGFERCASDHCVYVKRVKQDFVILTLYVDDMLLVGNNKKLINTVKSLLSKQFDMKDLGAANFILGMKITRDRKGKKLWLGQQKYIEEVLQRFNMADCKPVGTPIALGSKLSAEQCPKTDDEFEEMSKVPYASAVGSLMYAMICTRPDIAQTVGVLSRYMSKPGKEHWAAVKRVFRYLRGTSDRQLCYGGHLGTKDEINGFVDADWGGDLDLRRSTSGYVFKMNGGAISWMSKRQDVVALSSTEAEYMALTQASKEAIWLRRFCSELGLSIDPIKIMCDSKSAIDLAKNPTFHARTKHIDIQYHFIRERVESNKVRIEKVDTKENTADFLTKAVTMEKFNWCAEECGLLVILKKAALVAKYSSSGRLLKLTNISNGPNGPNLG